MGSGYLVKCGNCSYEEQFHLGIGFRYCPEPPEEFFDRIIRECVEDEHTLEDIRRILVEGSGKLLAYGHRIYRCKPCGALHNRLYLKLENGGGYYVVSYPCPVCGRKMRSVSVKSLQGSPCPNCGSQSLACEENLCWD